MSKELSSSPERHTFSKQSYIQKLEEDPNDQEALGMINLYEDYEEKQNEIEKDPKWQKNNLEYDLRTTDWILKKTRDSDTYAQNLYAALCNNDFVKNEMWPILKGDTWHCSWRYAGGIIADMQEKGDYINWFCSGIRDVDLEVENTKYDERKYVPESIVTDEIRNDLLKLGWIVVSDEEE